MAKNIKTKFCPKCKSTNIDYKPSVGQAALGLIPKWKCQNCGFESITFPEKETKQ